MLAPNSSCLEMGSLALLKWKAFFFLELSRPSEAMLEATNFPFSVSYGTCAVYEMCLSTFLPCFNQVKNCGTINL